MKGCLSRNWDYMLILAVRCVWGVLLIASSEAFGQTCSVTLRTEHSGGDGWTFYIDTSGCSSAQCGIGGNRHRCNWNWSVAGSHITGPQSNKLIRGLSAGDSYTARFEVWACEWPRTDHCPNPTATATSNSVTLRGPTPPTLPTPSTPNLVRTEVRCIDGNPHFSVTANPDGRADRLCTSYNPPRGKSGGGACQKGYTYDFGKNSPFPWYFWLRNSDGKGAFAVGTYETVNRPNCPSTGRSPDNGEDTDESDSGNSGQGGGSGGDDSGSGSTGGSGSSGSSRNCNPEYRTSVTRLILSHTPDDPEHGPAILGIRSDMLGGDGQKEVSDVATLYTDLELPSDYAKPFVLTNRGRVEVEREYGEVLNEPVSIPGMDETWFAYRFRVSEVSYPLFSRAGTRITFGGWRFLLQRPVSQSIMTECR